MIKIEISIVLFFLPIWPLFLNGQLFFAHLGNFLKWANIFCPSGQFFQMGNYFCPSGQFFQMGNYFLNSEFPFPKICPIFLPTICLSNWLPGGPKKVLSLSNSEFPIPLVHPSWFWNWFFILVPRTCQNGNFLMPKSLFI